ncbi:hypothetical protein FRC06_008231, partial [Ceratobasidium sp. 370]
MSRLPRPDPNTATESETEPEPVLQWKSTTQARRAAPSPSRHVATPEPPMIPRKPLILVPASSSLSPIPEPRPTKPATQASRAGPHKRLPRPNPDTATESESEPEPVLRPKPKKLAGSHRLSQPGAKPPTRHQPPHQPPPSRHESNTTLSSGDRNGKAFLKRLGDILNGDSDNDNDESLLNWTLELLEKRQRHNNDTHRPSSSRQHQHGNAHRSSSSRQHQHGDARRLSPSYHRPGPSTSHPARLREVPDDESLDPDAPHTSGSSTVDDDSDSPVDVTKSGLGKYPGTRGKAASRAIPGLLSTATRKGIYQEQDTYVKWARNAYRRAWARYYSHVRYKDPPLDLLRTIILRISGLRTEIKKHVRALVKYLFNFTNPGSSRRLMAANRTLFNQLFPNTFHCRDLRTDVNQFEHPAFVHAICEAYYWHQDSFAVRDHDLFKVMPLPAVALVLTMMQDSIKEWETGVFRARENNFRAQRDMFDAHLQGLYEYQKVARSRLHRFQGKWFRKGMRYAGVRILDSTEEGRFCQPITRACDVRPDTPELSEPEYDENGRLTARAK